MGSRLEAKIPLTLAALLFALSATAQNPREDHVTGADDDSITGTDSDVIGDANDDVLGDDDEAVADAREQINESVDVVKQMKADPEVAQLLESAHGVFIVPGYAQAGLIVGGEGGQGVVMLRQDGASSNEWTDPVFFDFGGATLGAEAGVEAGSIAMLIMSERAAEMFENEDNNFSLDASAGFTIVDYSAKAEASVGKGDVIVWSDTEGAFAGAAIGVSGINRDEDETKAYYGSDVDPQELLSGNRSSERATALHDALSG